MPVVTSHYQAPLLFKNGHIATIYSGLFRKVNAIQSERERLLLPDGDFIDLDWSFSSATANRLVILLHGLEGDADRPYMLGSARLFNANNYDVVRVNFRGCSGEPNSKYRSYHSGATDDLNDIILWILETKKYDELYIKGFSLGGNIALKYLGEGNEIPKEIKAAMAVSVPCSLGGSCTELHTLKNRLYHDRFKKHLIAKLKQKYEQFPSMVTRDQIKSIRTLKDFDDVYTSKAHGFKDADDYYKQCSSLQFLHNIKVPSLILNAKNDSFLSDDCYPENKAAENSKLYLEIPTSGGHVGFYQSNNLYYNEKRSLNFFEEKGHSNFS
ncbi:MAG: alpha/beta fold hydrolase [Flavobacteriaceae bacterium]|nr:alpha/beta fold hydrolase [Flavobacteriaceae bacterium]